MKKQMTDIEIKKAKLAALRLAAGITDEMVRMPSRLQMPDGSNESDYRYRRFNRYHGLRAA